MVPSIRSETPTLVVARSDEAIGVVQSHGYTGSVEVVPNAVDEVLFRPMDRASCRNTLGMTGFVVGFVGRLVEEKGLLDLVDAVAKCPPDINAAIVGTGPFLGAINARRKALHRRSGACPACQAAQELPQFMNAIDCLALPSTQRDDGRNSSAA